MSKPRQQKPNSFFIEFVPVLVFVGLYSYLRRSDPDGAIYTAALVFGVCAVAGLVYSWWRYRQISVMLGLSTGFIAVSVGLAYFFQNPVFVYMKPTIINLLFAGAIFGGLLTKTNIIQRLLGETLALPEFVWHRLAIRWGLFFIVLAILNEFVWRYFGEAFWVKFKLFGFIPLSVLFTFAQVPLILRHAQTKG